MYTSIDSNEVCTVIWEYLNIKYNKKFTLLIVKVLQWIMKNSYVKFDNTYYHQIKGLAMGTQCAPVVANLYMALLERKASNFVDISIQTIRYIDDIFIVNLAPLFDIDMEMSRVKFYLQNIYLESNKCFKFKESGQGNKVNFLDLTLEIEEHAFGIKIKTSTFNKPMNLHIYTDPDTFYPPSYIFNWIQGENIRFIRNSSNEIEYNRVLNAFIKYLKRRNYSKNIIIQKINKNNYNNQNNLLYNNNNNKNKEANDWDIIIPIENNLIRPYLNHILIIL